MNYKLKQWEAISPLLPQIKKYISSVFLLLRVIPEYLFLQDGLALLKSILGLEIYLKEIIVQSCNGGIKNVNNMRYHWGEESWVTLRRGFIKL